jgi:hypothetical protein
MPARLRRSLADPASDPYRDISWEGAGSSVEISASSALGLNGLAMNLELEFPMALRTLGVPSGPAEPPSSASGKRDEGVPRRPGGLPHHGAPSNETRKPAGRHHFETLRRPPSPLYGISIAMPIYEVRV